MIMTKRNIYTIDAEGKVLGRLATEVCLMLRGKDEPTYKPHLDNGAEVIIKNIDKLKFTGKKLDQKVYKHHTNYLGHLKVTNLKDIYQKKPALVSEKAVYNMLPKNKLRPLMMKRLKFA